MNANLTFVIMLVGMFALMFFMQRSQKKQAEKRMESLNKTSKRLRSNHYWWSLRYSRRS